MPFYFTGDSIAQVFQTQVEELREFLEPLLKKVMDVMIPETVDDWASCFTDISVSVCAEGD